MDHFYYTTFTMCAVFGGVLCLFVIFLFDLPGRLFRALFWTRAGYKERTERTRRVQEEDEETRPLFAGAAAVTQIQNENQDKTAEDMTDDEKTTLLQEAEEWRFEE